MRAGGLTTSDVAFLKDQRSRFRGALNPAYSFGEPIIVPAAGSAPPSSPQGRSRGVGEVLNARLPGIAHDPLQNVVCLFGNPIGCPVQGQPLQPVVAARLPANVHCIPDQRNHLAKAVAGSFQFPTPKFAEPRPVSAT